MLGPSQSKFNQDKPVSSDLNDSMTSRASIPLSSAPILEVPIYYESMEEMINSIKPYTQNDTELVKHITAYIAVNMMPQTITG